MYTCDHPRGHVILGVSIYHQMMAIGVCESFFSFFRYSIVFFSPTFFTTSGSISIYRYSLLRCRTIVILLALVGMHVAGRGKQARYKDPSLPLQLFRCCFTTLCDSGRSEVEAER